MTAVTAESLGWQDHAACRGADPGLFFGPDGERQTDRDAREAEAKRMCAGCPVRSECLDWALARPRQHGVAGGMGEDERQAHRATVMRRRRADSRKDAA